MKIAVLSDIHDNLVNLDLALQKIKELQAETMIFCGDFCSPFAAKQLAGFGLPVHAVFGNNDGDPFAILKQTTAFPE